MKLLIAALFSAVLLLPQHIMIAKKKSAGGGPVSYDTTTTSGTNTDGTSLPSFDTTVGSLTNGVIVVTVLGHAGSVGATPTGLSVTVGGSAASAVSGTAQAFGFMYIQMFCIAVGTTSGAKAVDVSWTSPTWSSIVVAAASFSGVDQSTPCQNGTGTTYALAVTSASLAITTATNNMTLDGIGNQSADTFSGGTQTVRWDHTQSNNAVRGTGSTGTGATSVTHAWTTGGDRGVHCGLDLKVAP